MGHRLTPSQWALFSSTVIYPLIFYIAIRAKLRGYFCDPLLLRDCFVDRVPPMKLRRYSTIASLD